MAALPPEILAIAPDQRGCGQSDKSEAGYEVASLAADVAALVDALDLVDFHLIAHSNAGAVAMEYVFTHPECAATLTLVDTAPVEGVFTPIDTYLLLEQLKTDRQLLTEAVTLLAPSLWRTPEVTPANRRLLDELVADAQQMAPAAFTEIARGLAQWNRFADARQLTLPTLLVWGDQDVIVDRDATTRTLIAIPGASNLEVFRNIGHSPHLEAPQQLADRWIDFILEDFDGYDAVRQRAQ